MTVAERLVPVYAWFGIGYGVMSLFMAVINFGMLAVTMLTVRGIQIPAWAILVFAVSIGIACILLGGFFVHYDVQSRVTSYLNCQSNPEIDQIAKDVKWLRDKAEK